MGRGFVAGCLRRSNDAVDGLGTPRSPFIQKTYDYGKQGPRLNAAHIYDSLTRLLTQGDYGHAAAGEEKVLRKVYHPLTDEDGDWRENHGRKTRSSG